MSLKPLLCLLLSCSIAFAAPPSPGKNLVHLRIHDDLRSVAIQLADSFGDQPRFDRTTHEFTFRLNPNLDKAKALAYFNGRREIDRAWIDGVPAPPLDRDLHSVHGIDKLIEEIEHKGDGRDERDERHNGPEKENGTDYLEALKAFTKLRAYPYSKIDWAAYDRAVGYVKRMHPANGSAGGGLGLAMEATTSKAAEQLPNWAYIGPNHLGTAGPFYNGLGPVSGRVNALAIDPHNSSTYYIGGGQGGVWKSTDAGTTWKPLTDAWPYLSVSAITIDPTNSNTIYVGTGDYQGFLPYCFGLMKSTDAGATWVNYGQSAFGTQAVSALVVDPDNPNIVTVTTGRGQGYYGYLWRSTDGGKTWSQANSTYGPWDCVCYGLSGSGGRIYYAMLGGWVPGLYKSTNQGQTWTLTNAPFPQAGNNYYWGEYVCASAVDPKTVYFLDGPDQAIEKSTDGGATWSNITNDFPEWNSISPNYNWSQTDYDYYIAAIPNNGTDDLIVGLIDIDESQNGGAHWTSIGNTPSWSATTHNDQHGFAWNGSNSNAFLMGNDGGVYSAVRNGSGWNVTSLNANLGLTMFYNAQWHPTDPTQTLGGSQDNGTPLSTGDLSNWPAVIGGDGFWCVIKPDNPQIQVGTVYNLDVRVTYNDWQDYGIDETYYDSNGDAWNGEPTTFFTKVFQDPVNTDYLYACTDYLWRFSYSTQTWTPDLSGSMLTKDNTGQINVVAVDPEYGYMIYTGATDGLLEFSEDEGNSFQVIANSGAALPNRAITAISVDPTNPNSILVGYSGTGTGHLYRVDNTYSNNPTYTDLDGAPGWTLPDIPLDCLERDPYHPNTWYVGTDIGLFRTTDAGTHWSNMTAPRGLPNEQVVSINANGNTGQLSCATYGRGMWRMPLGSTYLIAPSAFSVEEGKLESGDVQSLAKAGDGKVMGVSSASNKGNQTVDVETDFTVPQNNGVAATLALTVDSAASTDETETVYLYNFSTQAWIKVAQFAASTKLTIKTLKANGTIPNLVRASDGYVRTKLEFVKTGPSKQPFQVTVDQVQLKAQTSY